MGLRQRIYRIIKTYWTYEDNEAIPPDGSGAPVRYGCPGADRHKYLDDAYYRRSDLKKIDKEERRKAELRRAAEKAEREAWEKEQAALIANYKKKQADREIDAYNGHLSLPEDTITLTRSELGRLLKEQRQKDGGAEVYGPYSSRLSRFYGDGSMTIQGARRVYIDADPWYNDIDYRYAGPDVYVRVGSSDPFWGSRFGWGTSWGWGSWYDPSTPPLTTTVIPATTVAGMGATMIPTTMVTPVATMVGITALAMEAGTTATTVAIILATTTAMPQGLLRVPTTSTTTTTPITRGSLDDSPLKWLLSLLQRTRSGYIGPQRSYDQGSMSQQGRTIYSDYPRTQQSRPVQQQRSYDSYPQRSYDQGSSNSTNNSNSGGGGGYTAPPRRR